MTSLNSRMRVHRPEGSALAGIVIVPGAVIVPETVAAVTLSLVGPPREEDGRWVPVLRLEQEADSDPLGRSIMHLVEGAAQVSVGSPSVERIGHSECIGCRLVPS